MTSADCIGGCPCVSVTRNNTWWLQTLDGSNRHPRPLSDALEWTDACRSLTIEDVRAAAAQWLSTPPVVVEVRPKIVPVVSRITR